MTTVQTARSVRRHLVRTVALGSIAGALALSGCSAVAASSAQASTTVEPGVFFDLTAVHTIEISYDESDYDAIIEEYAATGEKEWMTATVVIDGTTFEDVGLRLKGNSSLRGITTASADASDGEASVDSPEELPWLIRLDRNVEGQRYGGRSDFVVRGNTSESSLNEALALEMLQDAGVPTEQAAYVRLSVNGGAAALRLVIDLPDDAAYTADTFAAEGTTYKADASGDYSYRGTDVADYTTAWGVQDSSESDETAQYQPLIEFLDFVNNATDEEFASSLADHLDVEGFARYLAAQDLVGNSDDIDGPGNNSYLRYDAASGQMTVVAWDQNLSFGAMPGGAGGGMRPGGGTAPGGAQPQGMTPPDGATAPQGAAPNAAGRGMSQNNVLVTRFLANADFAALVDDATAELTSSLIDSGSAAAELDQLAGLLTSQAGDLIDANTVTKEADAIAAQLGSG